MNVFKNHSARTIATAGHLGWLIESNWTDPLLFAIYSVIRPLSGSAILVVMFAIVSGGDFSSPYYTAMYLGNAFYTFVGSLLTGISWSITDDRERYKTLKYIYISPIRFPLYLIGRSLARVAVGTAAVIISLGFGIAFLHVSIPLAAIDWGMFGVTFFLGIIILSAMGLLLAGVSMMLVHSPEYLGDTVSGAMYLFSGAVFPLYVLPSFLRPIGYALPMTYWFESLRRALLGGASAAFQGMNDYSNNYLLLMLTGSTIFFCVIAYFGFRWCSGRARDKALIDWTSNY